MNNNTVIEKIVDRAVLKYKLIIETGLHIGGNKESYGIGGVDSPVIKNPITNEPIIPGSSIKGKMRMLLEKVQDNEYSSLRYKNVVSKGFGLRNEEKNEVVKSEVNDHFTRIIFRDLILTNESKKELEIKLGQGFYTEIKAENSIDKVNGRANPRFIERVPAGAIFEGECIIQKLDTDKEEDFKSLIIKGFELMEKNYLGGNGSRGYGKIKIDYRSYNEVD